MSALDLIGALLRPRPRLAMLRSRFLLMDSGRHKRSSQLFRDRSPHDVFPSSWAHTWMNSCAWGPRTILRPLVTFESPARHVFVTPGMVSILKHGHSAVWAVMSRPVPTCFSLGANDVVCAGHLVPSVKCRLRPLPVFNRWLGFVTELEEIFLWSECKSPARCIYC